MPNAWEEAPMVEDWEQAPLEDSAPEQSQAWKDVVARGPVPFSARTPLPLPPQESQQPPAPYINPRAISRRVFERSIGDPRYADPSLMAATERMGVPDFDPVQADISRRSIAEAERVARTPLVNITPLLEASQNIQPAINLLKRIPAVNDVLGGATESLGEGLSSMTSPEGFSQLPAYAVPVWGEAMMLKGGLEAAKSGAENAVEAISTGDLRLLGKAGGEFAQAGMLGIPGARGLAKRGQAFLPEGARAVRPPPIPETVLADLPVNRGETAPIEGAQNALETRPVEEGVLAERPGTDAQRKTAETSGGDSLQRTTEKAEPPKVQEEVTTALKDFKEKPVAEIAHLIETLPFDELEKAPGVSGVIGAAFELGSRAKTPADVAALKATFEKLDAQKPEWMRKYMEAYKADDSAAMADLQKESKRKQIVDEAYQVATGENIKGQLQAIETIKTVKPDYEPPVPGENYLKEKAKSQRLAPEPVPGAEKFQQEAATPAAEAARKAVETSSTPTVKESLTGQITPPNLPREIAVNPQLAIRSIYEGIANAQDSIELERARGRIESAVNKSWISETQAQELRQAAEARVTGTVGEVLGEMPALKESLTTEPAPIASGAVAESKSVPKWTNATREKPLTLKDISEGKQKSGSGEGGFIDVGGVIDSVYDMAKKAAPAVRAGVESVRNIAKEALTLPKTGDLRRGVLQWSGKLQQSFNEAAQAQKEINTKVPDKARQEGITNWIQAGGDANVLRERAQGSSNPTLKAGYEAALNLTPDELAVANDVKAAFDDLGQRGQAHDVLGDFRENYTPQIWDLGKGPQFAGSRTLRNNFRFSKARTFDSFFDGEQAGFVPKTKEIGKLLPVYLHEMNTVIAARQLVSDMAKGKASDGRPLVAARGAEIPVEGDGGKASLVFPKMPKGTETLDYKTLDNQPALTGWRWLSEDAEGNPRFIKSDLALHPEALAKMKAVLGKSAIREWYQSQGSLVSDIPKSLLRGLDNYQSETKRTMLGFLAPFHQVQEGTHGIGHRVNPTFSVPKIDLVNDAAQLDSAKHGLMLQPDRASQSQFMEGFKTSGLVSKIPGVGRVADGYSDYLFHQYIPGLKYKTYQAILERNSDVYKKDLASGKVNLEDVKILSSEQANAAYGHLNYADLGRNPTFQHILQLGLLAPDFLEARARFTGQALKGMTGAKVGREQLIALATLTAAQAATAYVAAQLVDGEWEGNRPFEFRKGNRRYTMRSVPEDIATLINDPRRFSYSRLNPITGRGPVQGLSGVDWRGQKVTAGETAEELLKAPIPLTLRGAAGELPWIGKMLRPNTPLTIPEQLWGAVGIRISRFNPQAEVYKMVDEFKSKSGEPKLIAQAEQRAREVNPESSYKGLRDALEKNDLKAAREELDKIVPTKGHAGKSAYKVIDEAMRPFATGTDGIRHDKFFTGSRETESKFIKSMTPEQKKIYDKAKEDRRTIYERFRNLRIP